MYGIILLYSLINMSVIVENFKNGEENYLCAVNMGCIVLADLYLLYFVKMADEKNYYEKQLIALEQQAKVQYEYYLTQAKKYDQTIQILHDVNKHIKAIEGLYGAEQEKTAGEYATKIRELLKPLIPVQYTENPILNILLTDKESVMREKGISVTIKVDNVNLNFLAPIDITTIFGNLLDNAIEAAEKLEGEKYISIKIGSYHKMAQTPMTLEAVQPATATQTATSIELKSDRVTVTFDPATGMISRIISGGTEVPFKDGPVAVGMKMRYEPTLSYVRNSNEGAVYCAKYKGAADSIVWRLTDKGLLYMDAILLNRASGGGGFDDAFMDSKVFNLGLTFSYPEKNCSGMKWMGRGPYRVWKNRIPGTNYGVWHKEYNNTITGESFENLVYPEFKGYHANMYWATLESDTTPFTVYSRNDGIFFHVFTPEEPKGRVKDTMPKFPEGDISFLLDIPAICSFKPIEQQGPNSQPGNIRIKSGDEGLHLNLMFDFRQ